MRIKISLLVLLLGLVNIGFSQVTNTSKFNLGFEQNTLKDSLPDNWIKRGKYKAESNSTHVHSGKYSIQISNKEINNSFTSLLYNIPAEYKGKEIRLEAFVKTEDVKEGYAGIYLRIKGKNSVLAFERTGVNEMQGTTGWEKYEVASLLPEDARIISVGAVLQAEGTIWLDDFVVTIDGKDIQTLEPETIVLSKPELDTEFDKGSKISFDELTPQIEQNLYKLAKVWGFLKYHHPEIAKGNFNWDYELFRIMPAVKEADFDDQLYAWVKTVGPISEEFTKESEDKDIKLNANSNWISDASLMDEKLSKYLLKMQKATKEQENYYIGFKPGVGNPDFKNENGYIDMSFQDDGFKLLGLFRYWNMIEYFFPYRHLMDENWDSVLKTSIGKFAVAKTKLDYHLAVLEIVGKIQDTHGYIWQGNGALGEFIGLKSAPIKVELIEGKPVVTGVLNSMPEELGVKNGDVLVAVNGKDALSVLKEKLKYSPASNYPTQCRNACPKIVRTNEDNIELTLKNEKGEFTVNVPTVSLREVALWGTEVVSYKVVDETIGYIYPGSLEEGEIDEIMKFFIHKKALIIDLRCYPSDFIVFSLGKYLMPKSTEFARFTKGGMDNPGEFVFTNSLSVGEENEEYFKGKVVILLNETSQSNAEYTAMALKVAPKAIVVGSTTAGADGNVSQIIFPGRIQSSISGVGVYYPNKKETQRVGIIPDVECLPTINGVRSGRDEVLEKAIELIGEE